MCDSNAYINMVIENSHELLENDDVDELTSSLGDLNRMIQEIDVDLDEKDAVGELTTLSLYVEDLLNGNSEALSRAQLRNICDDLKKKVDGYKLFYRTFEKESDHLLTCGMCQRYLTKLDKSLCLLEKIFCV